MIANPEKEVKEERTAAVPILRGRSISTKSLNDSHYNIAYEIDRTMHYNAQIDIPFPSHNIYHW